MTEEKKKICDSCIYNNNCDKKSILEEDEICKKFKPKMEEKKSICLDCRHYNMCMLKLKYIKCEHFESEKYTFESTKIEELKKMYEKQGSKNADNILIFNSIEKSLLGLKELLNLKIDEFLKTLESIKDK